MLLLIVKRTNLKETCSLLPCIVSIFLAFLMPCTCTNDFRKSLFGHFSCQDAQDPWEVPYSLGGIIQNLVATTCKKETSLAKSNFNGGWHDWNNRHYRKFITKLVSRKHCWQNSCHAKICKTGFSGQWLSAQISSLIILACNCWNILQG